MRKLLICPYFGDLPEWWGKYQQEMRRLFAEGYDMLLDFDLDGFRQRVQNTIPGMICPIVPNTGKIWDYRPAFGKLYAAELEGYDWWGHTDFDCVYGRVSEFVTDEKLAGCDIYTDCAHGYLAGPWTLYRNTPRVNGLFTEVGGWRYELALAKPTGWIEAEFSDHAKRRVRVTVDVNHAYTQPGKLRRDGDVLWHGGREVPFFHFRRSKEWPL